jgi:KaiC/GvpD/RAD55 family RecA-like ATPase
MSLYEIEERVRKLGATRVVVDSLSGFEVALAPSFRQDFRESFYRLTQSLTALNITIVSTMETSGETGYLRFSPYNISFLSDDIVAMRYIELEGNLRTVLSVIKMRGSAHSGELRLVDITQTGMRVREGLPGYRGIITGVPEPRPTDMASSQQLTAAEAAVLDALLQFGESAAAEIARQSGLTLEEVTAVLDKLVVAGRVRVDVADDEPRYRASISRP